MWYLCSNVLICVANCHAKQLITDPDLNMLYNRFVVPFPEMKPCWFDEKDIPFKEMWPDDILWFPYFLNGKKFKGYFLFEGMDKILEQSIEEVETLEWCQRIAVFLYGDVLNFYLFLYNYVSSQRTWTNCLIWESYSREIVEGFVCNHDKHLVHSVQKDSLRFML